MDQESWEELKQNLFSVIRQSYPSARVELAVQSQQPSVRANAVTLQIDVSAYSSDFTSGTWIGTTAFGLTVTDTRGGKDHRASMRVEDRKAYSNTWGYASGGSALQDSYSAAIQKMLASFEGALAGFARKEDDLAKAKKLEEDEAAKAKKVKEIVASAIDAFRKAMAEAPGTRERLRVIRGFLDREFISADTILEEYSHTWGAAIESRRDFNSELQSTKARLDRTGLFAALAEIDKAAKESFKSIKNPSDDSKLAYETALDYYGTIAEAVSLAEAPSGSLLTFRQKREVLTSSAKQKSAKLELLTQ